MINNRATDPNYKILVCPRFNCDFGVEPEQEYALIKWLFHIRHHTTVTQYICFHCDRNENPVRDGKFRFEVSYETNNRERMLDHHRRVHGRDADAASRQTDLDTINDDYHNFWCQWCLEFVQMPTDANVFDIYRHFAYHLL